MTADRGAGDRDDADGADDPDIDMGEPIEALAVMRYEPGPGLIRLVRGSIRRRLLGREVTDMIWSAPRIVFVEFLKLLFRPFAREPNRNGDSGHD